MKNRKVLIVGAGFAGTTIARVLAENGFEVDIMTNIIGRVHGYLGTYNESTQSVFDLDDNTKYDQHMKNYDFLIIPGGVKSMEKVRQNKKIIQFISEFDKAGKTIGCICSGAQLLISAKVVNNRKISGYYSMIDDLINAGAKYEDKPSVIDKNIITTAHYKDLGPWMGSILKVFYSNK